MPFQPASNVVSAEFRYTWQGEKCENVIHCHRPGFTPGDGSALPVALYEAWAAEVAPITSNTVVLREVYVTDLTTAESPTWVYAPAVLAGGGNVNESTTNNQTICLSLRTALRGRSRRGRLYIVGLTDNVVSNNRVTLAAQDAWKAAWEGVRTVITDEGWSWVVLSRRTEGNVRPVASSATVTALTFTDDVIDSQRRRLPGRGE